jgi:succinoglycan biosynthesis protein ExoU
MVTIAGQSGLTQSRYPIEPMTDPAKSTDRCTDRAQSKPATACVDVVVAARDRADTIERAVASALSHDEVRAVIVVDDGSTDDTAARARRCDAEGKRVIVERLHASGGPAAARNVAIKMSTAPWLAILDADDFFLPGRIGELLSQSEDCDFVADDLVHVSEGCIGYERLKSVPFDGAFTNPRRLSFEQFVLGNVTRRGFHRKELGYLQPLIRRHFLDLHALRYDETLRFGEDYVLYARALAAGARFLLIPMAGYVAVERADSLSARHSRRDLEVLRDRVCEMMAMSHLTLSDREALAKLYADVDRRAQWLVLVEALQSHSCRRFLSAFFRSPSLTVYLTERLIAEIPLQVQKRIRRLRDR